MSLYPSPLRLCSWLGLVFLLQVLPDTCLYATVPKKDPKPVDAPILTLSNETLETDCSGACRASTCRANEQYAWLNNTCFLVTCSNASNCTDVSVESLLTQLAAEGISHDDNRTLSEPHANNSVSPSLFSPSSEQMVSKNTKTATEPTLPPPSVPAATTMSAVTTVAGATTAVATVKTTPQKKPSLTSSPLFHEKTKAPSEGTAIITTGITTTHTSTTTTSTVGNTTTTSTVGNTTTTSTVGNTTTTTKTTTPAVSTTTTSTYTTPPPTTSTVGNTTTTTTKTTTPAVSTTTTSTYTTPPPTSTTTTTTTSSIGNTTTPITATTTTTSTSTTPPPTTSTTTITTTGSSTSGAHDSHVVAMGTGIAMVEVTRAAFSSQLVDTASLLSVLLFGMLFFLVTVAVFVTQAYESYRRKDYTQVDYLINGMYTDSGV